MQVAIATHCFVARDSQEARDTFYPYYASYFRNHAPKTNYHPEVAREEFEARAAPDGAIFVGSPQEIIDKIMHERELFGHQRFLAQVDIGGLPYAKVAESIELLGTKVLPAASDRTDVRATECETVWLTCTLACTDLTIRHLTSASS